MSLLDVLVAKDWVKIDSLGGLIYLTFKQELTLKQVEIIDSEFEDYFVDKIFVSDGDDLCVKLVLDGDSDVSE